MEQYYTTGGCTTYCKSRMLFLTAALYNFGMAFFFVFMTGGIAKFSHAQFAAALLIVFGLMFCCLAACPVKFKVLIPFVILRNLAYCGVAGWYYYIGQLPWQWAVPAAIDGFLVLVFFCVWYALFDAEEF